MSSIPLEELAEVLMNTDPENLDYYVGQLILEHLPKHLKRVLDFLSVRNWIDTATLADKISRSQTSVGIALRNLEELDMAERKRDGTKNRYFWRKTR